MNPLQVAQLSPHEERCLSPEPSFTYPSGSPVKISERFLVNGPPTRFPSRAPMERNTHLHSLYISFWIPSKVATLPGSPNRDSTERDAPFPESSFDYLSKFPVNRTPPPLQVPQWGPYGENHPSPELSFTHPLIIHLSFKVHGKGAPLHVPTTGSLWREMLHLQSQWFIHLFISVRVPKKEPSHEMGGKTYSHCPCSPTWMEGLHIMQCGLVPQGDCL